MLPEELLQQLCTVTTEGFDSDRFQALSAVNAFYLLLTVNSTEVVQQRRTGKGTSMGISGALWDFSNEALSISDERVHPIHWRAYLNGRARHLINSHRNEASPTVVGGWWHNVSCAIINEQCLHDSSSRNDDVIADDITERPAETKWFKSP